MHYYNAVERDGYWLLGKSGFMFIGKQNPEPPLDFFVEEAQSMIKWGHEYFPNKTLIAKLPCGTLVFLQEVGRNASHTFFLGQSQDGQLFRVTGAEETVLFSDLMVGEAGEYLGNCEFSVHRLEMSKVGADRLNGYWGHA